MQDIPPKGKWPLRDKFWYDDQDGNQDSSGDEVINPNDDDEFEDFKPEPEPDLPWWAPLRHLIPYIPYLPITPLGMNLESNMNIDNLDLNFLLEAEAPPLMKALELGQQQSPDYFSRPTTTNDQGSDFPPNGGNPPKWAWEGPGFPWWWDPNNDGIIDDPNTRGYYEQYGFGRWVQDKNGEWYYEDFTKKFGGGAGNHPNTWPGWGEYFNPAWWIRELY